ncbi:hypothetical protein CVT26_005035 [Gymnopilus dilepis]|uniref:Mitochondrial splicing suppressor 51-like C-terminal domain-containing protein n=1 Tax=Gymnopilus dilepis TaxID=231916 RepID=A0A409Y057_9AGAR|nr:hypothetical protein CVT26_005035 [Gymnopilus dilepis]
MEKLPHTQGLTVKSFAWSLLDSGRTFTFDIARASFDCAFRTRDSDIDLVAVRGGVEEEKYWPLEYFDGKILSENEHLSDEDGWKLPSSLIPRRAGQAKAVSRPICLLALQSSRMICHNGRSLLHNRRRLHELPDALLACNSGLAFYSEWWPILQAVYRHRIPFPTTEYAEQSAEHHADMILTLLVHEMKMVLPMKKDEYKTWPEGVPIGQLLEMAYFGGVQRVQKGSSERLVLEKRSAWKST